MTQEEHKQLGIQFFNKTWDYIDMNNRTKMDDMAMIHTAHASRLHWELSGAPVLNIVRGEWQIARVYSLLEQGESALYHARYCFEQTLHHSIDDFDLVFAYEAMARALLLVGNQQEAHTYLQQGYNLLDQVQKDDDKEYCKSELDQIKDNLK